MIADKTSEADNNTADKGKPTIGLRSEIVMYPNQFK